MNKRPLTENGYTSCARPIDETTKQSEVLEGYCEPCTLEFDCFLCLQAELERLVKLAGR